MRILAILILSFVLLSCQQVPEKEKIVDESDPFTTPKKTVCYQIQNQSNMLGYAEKYEWENKKGVPRNYYFVYNLDQDLVGHIGVSGKTVRYEGLNQSIDLGNRTLEKGLAGIFEQSQVHVFPVSLENKEVALRKKEKSTFLAKSTQKEKKPQTVKAEKDVYEESDYEDSSYEDSDYEDSSYEDSDYEDSSYEDSNGDVEEYSEEDNEFDF